MTSISAPTTSQFQRIFSFRDWRLGQKLMLAFVAFAILPLVVAGSISVNAARDALLSQAKINLLSYSHHTANQLDQYLANHSDDIVMVSQLSEVAAFMANPNDSTTRARVLKVLSTAANRRDYESVSLVDATGATVFSSSERDIGMDVNQSQDYVQAMRGAIYVSDPAVSQSTGRPAIYFSAPILDPVGKIVGVARSRLSLDGIWALVESDKERAGQGTVGILLDENGIRLAHSLSRGGRDAIANSLLYRAVAPLSKDAEKQIIDQKRFGVAAAQTVEVIPLPEVARTLGTSDEESFESSADKSNVRHYAAAVSLSAKPWRYILMTPISTFTRLADDLVWYFVLITLFVGAFTIVGVFFITRGITRPIIHLTKVADRISLGDLTAKIEIDRKDEIGELAEAVSRMQTSLQGAINRLRARRTPTP